MLHLQLATDPRWVNLAEKQLEEILTDHAFCEQKAASSCISLIQKYSEYEALVEAVSPVVTEEWAHFRTVLEEMQKRNMKLGKQRKDEYVNLLMKLENKNQSAHERLLDKLLQCALIEARSCERFKLLSEKLEDDYFRKFYRGFMISEAGHYRLFIDLAKKYFGEEKVKTRWKAYLDYEKEIMESIELRGDRMH